MDQTTGALLGRIQGIARVELGLRMLAGLAFRELFYFKYVVSLRGVGKAMHWTSKRKTLYLLISLTLQQNVCCDRKYLQKGEGWTRRRKEKDDVVNEVVSSQQPLRLISKSVGCPGQQII